MQFHGNDHLPGPLNGFLLSTFALTLRSESFVLENYLLELSSQNSALQISRWKIFCPKIKKPTRLASGLKIFLLDSLTETPPATRMDAT
jgi:hypothetical protein